MAVMLGWLSDANTCASRLKRERRSGSFVNASGRSLRATSRLSFVSDARYTSPIPPSPSFETTRYGPSELPIMLEQLREPFYTRGRRLERSAFVAVPGGPGEGRPPCVPPLGGVALPLCRSPAR